MAEYVIEDREKMQFSVSREALVSPDVLEREQRAIFEKCWIYVGHGSEVREPGDFRTRLVAGRPVIFCRDRQGVARAFLNTCRHRGTLVCHEREGRTRYFTCPYHGWTYDTNGTLHSVPGDDAYGPHFHKEQFGLEPPPRFDSYRDFYFLNLDPAAPALADYLGNTREYIDLVIDQSPSGQLEIVAGVQEYDIRANWKLLVENSVDDYHLPSTHSTWLNYMRSAGVTTRPPRDSGLLLPTKGAGKDLGNGHLTTDNPNFRGRPVAAWISIYGEAAKDDIAAIRRDLVARLGEARAARVADTNRNLVVFPNLVVNDGSSVTVRTFFPTGPDHMHVTAWALGPVEETPAQRARRLDAFLTFYGPGGFATPDDVAALELLQRGLVNWREVRWSDLSRGMNKAPTDQLDTDEGHIRVFWRRWNELMEAPR
jgi:phenylpropionate dioxygenase-like ring-hydroxylating dioxygenase large terminal subunit